MQHGFEQPFPVGVTYRFARDGTGRLIDVCDLTPQTRDALGPYRCLDCGDEMIPSLGAQVTHHFRHKTSRSTQCSRESYLHEAAKLAVAEAIQAAMDGGAPYLVERECEVICRHHEAEFGLVCQQPPRLEAFNVATWFRSVSTERRVGGFVADVLLEGAAGQQMLIEIEVTHACEPAKLGSGLKIIEVKIQHESDVAAARKGLRIDGLATRGYNLKPLRREVGQCSGCTEHSRVFLVYRSGKSVVVEGTLDEVAALRRRQSLLHSAVVGHEWQDFPRPANLHDHYIRRARYDLGMSVTSCSLCISSAFSLKADGRMPPMRCFKRACNVSLNDAATCSDYVEFPTGEALAKRRAAQAAYAARRQWGRTTDSLVDVALWTMGGLR